MSSRRDRGRVQYDVPTCRFAARKARICFCHIRACPTKRRKSHKITVEIDCHFLNAALCQCPPAQLRRTPQSLAGLRIVHETKWHLRMCRELDRRVGWLLAGHHERRQKHEGEKPQSPYDLPGG